MHVSIIDYNPSSMKVFKMINDQLFIIYGKYSVNYFRKNIIIKFLVGKKIKIKNLVVEKESS